MYTQNLKELKNFKATLMKTSKIPLCEIDKNFIDSITVKWDDVSEMEITVANRILIDGEIVDNSYIYNSFKGKRQQLVISNPAIRFVIAEVNRRESSIRDNNGKGIKTQIKEIKLRSYEETLGELILTEDIQRQLWNDGTDEMLDISNGILNMFEQDNQGWKVKHVSEDAMKEFGKIESEFEDNIGVKVAFDKVERSQVLWEKDFNVDPFNENLVMSLKIMYGGVKTYSNDNIQDDTMYVHKIDNIYTGIRKIKAIYNKSETGSYSINYQITLSDGIVLDKWCLFSYCDGLDLKIDKILMTYTTGEEYEGFIIKYRVFEEGTYPWLDFLRKNVANAYGDLYFEFDTIAKELSVYTKKEYGVHKGIQFSYDNFVQEINKVDALDEVVSKLYVYSNNCSIADVNMFGGCDYILNYDYFYNNDGMTPQLMESWDRYIAVIEGKSDELYDLRLQINTHNKKLVKVESERTAIDYDIRNLEIRRTSYIADNKNGEFDEDIERLSREINEKKDKFESLMVEIQSIKDDIAKVNGKIKQITQIINLETSEDENGTIFNDDLLEELRDITVEDTVDDDNYLTSNGLYGRYLDVIKEKNTQGIDFEIDSKGFLDNIIVPEGLEWDFYIKMGDFVDLEDNEILIDKRGLRIVEYTLIPKDGEVEVKNIKLTNRDIQLEDYGGAGNVKRDVARNNSYINNYKDLWNESVNVNDFYNKITGEGMDLRATTIRSRSNKVKFDFTEAGLYVINNDEEVGEDMQIYLGAGMVCFTNDRWLTCKTAIDTAGIVAKNLVGEIILGEKLFITSELGEFYIGNMNDNSEGFGLSIKEGSSQRIFLGTEMVNGVRKAKLRLYGKNGGLTLSEDGILSPNQLVVTDNLSQGYDLNIPFVVDEGVNILKKVQVTLLFDKYRGYTRGSGSGGGTSATSSDGGGFNYGSTTSGGGASYSTTTTTTTGWSGMGSGNVFNTSYPQNWGQQANHYHYMSEETMRHTHGGININIPSHSHSFSVSQNNHRHSVTLQNHLHEEIHGIYIDNNSNVENAKIYVNDVLVAENIYTNTIIDITNKLKLNSVNYIRISNEKNVRVTASIYSKAFTLW